MPGAQGHPASVSHLNLTSTAIKCLIGLYRACWADRKRHLPDDGALAELRGAMEVDRMLSEQFSLGRTGLPKAMYHHFRLPLHFLLSRDLQWKRTWLDSVLASRARQARRLHLDDGPLKAQRAFLFNWLRRPASTPTSSKPSFTTATLRRYQPASLGRREKGRRASSSARR